MAETIWVYSEQTLTPRAAEVISSIKNAAGYGDWQFKYYNGNFATKVLVFGSKTPSNPMVEYIHTYSIAQIMSKPNALTVVKAALDLYSGKAHAVPEGMQPQGLYDGVTPLSRFGFSYTLPIAIDIETDGNLGVTHTPEDVRVISVALYQPGKAPFVYVHPQTYGDRLPVSHAVTNMFREELPKFTKAIYHNGKFDTRVLNRVLGVELKVWFDTMLAHHSLNHAAGMHGLKELCQKYLGAPNWEEGLKSYTLRGGHYERIPQGVLIEYNGWDVYWTYQLYELLSAMLEADDDAMKCFEFELEAAKLLLRVEQNGIPISNGAVYDLINEKTVIIEAETGLLRKYTGDENFNPNSPQQVKKVLANMGIHVPKTDVETIEMIAETTHNTVVKGFCHSLIRLRKAMKIKSTYAEGWLKEARSYRVHPTFNVHGTTTGRLSSRAPNAQNMPRDKAIRKIVTVGEE